MLFFKCAKNKTNLKVGCILAGSPYTTQFVRPCAIKWLLRRLDLFVGYLPPQGLATRQSTAQVMLGPLFQ